MTDVSTLTPTDAQAGDTLLGARGPTGALTPVLLKIPTLVGVASATTFGTVTVPAMSNLTLTSGSLSMTLSNVTAALGFTPYPSTGGTLAGSMTVTGNIKLGDNQTIQLSTDGTKTLAYDTFSSTIKSTAPILLPADPTTALEACTKAYADAHGGGGSTNIFIAPTSGNTVTTLGGTDYIAAWNTPSAANEFITTANFITQNSVSLASVASYTAQLPSSALILGNVAGVDYALTAAQVKNSQQASIVTTASTLTLSQATHNGQLIVVNGTCTISAPSAATLGDNFRCRIVEVASGGTATLDSSFTSSSTSKTMSQWQGADIWVTTGAGGAVIAMMQYGQLASAAPGSVVSLTSPSQGSTTITLSWAAGSGPPATSWTVTQRTPSGSGSYSASAGSFTATGGTVTGLTVSTPYDFQVVATNSSGSSSPTTLTNISTTSSSNGPSYPTPSTGSPTLLFHLDTANYTGHLYSDTGGTTQAVTGGNVSYIKDLSGSGNHMTLTGTGSPGTLNAGVSSTGWAGLGINSNTCFESIASTLATAMQASTSLTVMIVFKATGTASNGYILAASDHTRATTDPQTFFTITSGTLYQARYGSGLQYIAVNSTANGGPSSWFSNGSSTILRFNGFGTSGTPYTEYCDAKCNAIAVTGAVGSTSFIYNDSETDGTPWDVFTLGGAITSNHDDNGQISGNILEVMIWSSSTAHTAISNGDVTAIQTYIHNKWGTGF